MKFLSDLRINQICRDEIVLSDFRTSTRKFDIEEIK